MPDDIGECFLGNTEAGSLDHWIKAVLQRVGGEARLQARQSGLLAGVPAQSGLQAQVVQQRRAQAQREIAHLAEHSPDSLQAFVEVIAQQGSIGGVHHCLEVHLRDREGLPYFVVELARDVPALGLL